MFESAAEALLHVMNATYQIKTSLSIIKFVDRIAAPGRVRSWLGPLECYFLYWDLVSWRVDLNAKSQPRVARLRSRPPISKICVSPESMNPASVRRNILNNNIGVSARRKTRAGASAHVFSFQNPKPRTNAGMKAIEK